MSKHTSVSVKHLNDDLKMMLFRERMSAAAPDLYRIAVAYRNLLKTMAHTEGEVATYQHICDIINTIEGE